MGELPNEMHGCMNTVYNMVIETMKTNIGLVIRG